MPYIHALVLEAFVSPRPPGAEASHLNAIKSDNRLSNLAWESHATNERRKPQTRLSVEAVLAIRESAETGAVLGLRYGVNKRTISKIKLRRKWRDVG